MIFFSDSGNPYFPVFKIFVFMSKDTVRAFREKQWPTFHRNTTRPIEPRRRLERVWLPSSVSRECSPAASYMYRRRLSVRLRAPTDCMWAERRATKRTVDLLVHGGTTKWIGVLVGMSVFMMNWRGSLCIRDASYHATTRNFRTHDRGYSPNDHSTHPTKLEEACS